MRKGQSPWKLRAPEEVCDFYDIQTMRAWPEQKCPDAEDSTHPKEGTGASYPSHSISSQFSEVRVGIWGLDSLQKD